MAEARCTDLGSACVCSEPMQMTGFDSGPDYWNPNDTATLECGNASDDDGPIVRTTNDVASSTDATALAALPAEHSVSRFLRGPEGHTGTFYIGHELAVSSSLVRLAARWYRYFSSNFEFKDDGGCENTKLGEIDHGGILDITDSGNGTHKNVHAYGFTGWSPSTECCTSGPAPNFENHILTADLLGKWWRFEVVLTNRAGPDFRMQLFGVNVSDGDPEVTLIDTDEDPDFANGISPPGLVSGIRSNGHRFGTGGCNGWNGYLHYLMAGWDSNAGQRIGAATEVEGGEGGGGGGGIVFGGGLSASGLG